VNFFEQELRRLAKACAGLSNPVFAGRACYGDLGGDVRVKLQFVTLGHADHYEAVKATILNRVEGDVDYLLFRFADIWGKKQVSNRNFSDGIIPYIWTRDGKHDWYVYNPTDADMKRLAAEIGGYIDVFKDRTAVLEKAPARVEEKDSVVEKLRAAKKNPVPQKAPAKGQRRETEIQS
jgi:hypothetical protein